MNRYLGSGDDSPSILLDEDGNEYDSYSLAWRYLGMYIDCDIFGYDGFSRKLESGDEDCDRIVLWALYHDPGYRGGQIGEYQFYDLETESWDASTCKTRRCARLDCHEPRSRYKLLGVYKEKDGMIDWAEQLFKHQGYCIWDEDSYEYMQERYEKWPQKCTLLYYTYDQYGGYVYWHIKPEAGGNFTYGFFSDDTCGQPSTLTVEEYISTYSYNNGGGSSVNSYRKMMRTTNDLLSVYKTCQPCRAYNLNKNNYDDYTDDGSGDRRHRKLEGDNEDGEGEEEKWGYNCYDDAGYTNCHQCYKFQAKTDMEEASAYDLLRASEQGTILEIIVDGVTYGEGRFTSIPGFVTPTNILILVAFGLAVITFSLRRNKTRRPGNAPIFKTSLEPSFNDSFEKPPSKFEEKIVYPSLLMQMKKGPVVNNKSIVTPFENNVKPKTDAENKKNDSLTCGTVKKDSQQNDYHAPGLNRVGVAQEINNGVVETSLRSKAKETHEMVSAAFTYVRLSLFRDKTIKEERKIKESLEDESTLTSDYTRYSRDDSEITT